MFRRPGSIKLMELFGIRIGVDGTWFIVLFLMIFWLSGPFRQTLHSSDGVAYLTTVITALMFFGSLIMHELGHALVARRQGIEVRRIELFLFGGLTQMSRDAQSPGEEFKIAAAGPLATLGFVVLCLVIDMAIVGPHRLKDAAELSSTVRITPVLLSLSWLLLMNVLIFLFNLIPAFPLDGGRIARERRDQVEQEDQDVHQKQPAERQEHWRDPHRARELRRVLEPVGPDNRHVDHQAQDHEAERRERPRRRDLELLAR